MNYDLNAVLAGNSNWNVITECPNLQSMFLSHVIHMLLLSSSTLLRVSGFTVYSHGWKERKKREPFAKVENRKDKTLTEILDRLKTLESKIDNLSTYGNMISSEHGSITGHTLVQTPGPMSDGSSGLGTSISSAYPPPPPSEALHLTGNSFYKYSSSVRAMFAWPTVRELLNAVLPMDHDIDELAIGHNSASILLGLRQSTALPKTGFPISPGPSILEHQPLGNTSSTPGVAGSLTWDNMQTLSTAFFDTFNLLHPIVDRQHFVTATLPAVVAAGFDDSIEATLTHLIFSLGEVAMAGTQGPPVGSQNGRPSGVRGGSKTQPPGLVFFNEARRRMGFNLTDCSLENVQVYALAGIYYETCFHHGGFWRMTTSASLACQALIMNNPAEPMHAHMDIVRRNFWHCSIMETFLELELGIPATGLDKYEARVPVPDFGGGFSQEDLSSNQASHFQEHFASQIVLRRLSTDFNTILSNASSTMALAVSPTPSKPTLPETIRSLSMQLDHWRETLLPRHLHWYEDHPEGLPGPPQDLYDTSSYAPGTSMTTKQESIAASSGRSMFTADLSSPVMSYPYAMDIQVALLRTRYYHTKHLIHRPFLYKVLHHPDQIVQGDAEGVATCLLSCLKWPLIMNPPCTHKRLIPCVFFWTQNLLSVLIVLYLSEKVPILMRIRTTLCGDRFECEARETVTLAIEWIRDLKEVDTAAEWAWGIVKDIYGLEE